MLRQHLPLILFSQRLQSLSSYLSCISIEQSRRAEPFVSESCGCTRIDPPFCTLELSARGLAVAVPEEGLRNVASPSAGERLAQS